MTGDFLSHEAIDSNTILIACKLELNYCTQTCCVMPLHATRLFAVQQHTNTQNTAALKLDSTIYSIQQHTGSNMNGAKACSDDW